MLMAILATPAAALPAFSRNRTTAGLARVARKRLGISIPNNLRTFGMNYSEWKSFADQVRGFSRVKIQPLTNLIPQFLYEVGEYLVEARLAIFHVKKAKLRPMDLAGDFDHLTTRPTTEEIERGLASKIAVNEARARVRAIGQQLSEALEAAGHDSSGVLLVARTVDRGEPPYRIARAMEAVAVRLQRILIVRSVADSGKKSGPRSPDNPDVRDLCRLLEKHGKGGKSYIQIARDFTREKPGSDSRARSLLRQACRFRHLWSRADS
jgi:hypothetical protein